MNDLMEANLNYVEGALVASLTGPAYESSENYIIAAGWAGQRNSLGFAIYHLLKHQNEMNCILVTNLLAKELVKQQRCKAKDAPDIAKDALFWYMTKNCLTCNGTGVINQEQAPCHCKGGEIAMPSREVVQNAIALIKFHIEWLDNQIKVKLRGA